MAYVQADQDFAPSGLGQMRTARQRRRGAKRRRRKARKLSKTVRGRARLATAARAVAEGTATGRARRLVASAGELAARTRRAPVRRRLRMVRELAARTPAPVGPAASTILRRRLRPPAAPIVERVTEDPSIIPIIRAPVTDVDGGRPPVPRSRIGERIRDQRRRREQLVELEEARPELPPAFVQPVEFGPDRPPFDFRPSPPAEPGAEAPGAPGWLIPAALAAAAFLL